MSFFSGQESFFLAKNRPDQPHLIVVTLSPFPARVLFLARSRPDQPHLTVVTPSPFPARVLFLAKSRPDQRRLIVVTGRHIPALKARSLALFRCRSLRTTSRSFPTPWTERHNCTSRPRNRNSAESVRYTVTHQLCASTSLCLSYILPCY